MIKHIRIPKTNSLLKEINPDKIYCDTRNLIEKTEFLCEFVYRARNPIRFQHVESMVEQVSCEGV